MTAATSVEPPGIAHRAARGIRFLVRSARPRRPVRCAVRAALLVVLALGFGGCAVVGPQSIAAGRGVYTEVLNRTEDEQILSAMVRIRYLDYVTTLEDNGVDVFLWGTDGNIPGGDIVAGTSNA